MRASASNASWLRWPALRVSSSMAACEGEPLTHGVSSAELHIPGAASLANTGSNVARASGVKYPLIGDIPSMSCLPMMMPRRRARS